MATVKTHSRHNLQKENKKVFISHSSGGEADQLPSWNQPLFPVRSQYGTLAWKPGALSIQVFDPAISSPSPRKVRGTLWNAVKHLSWWNTSNGTWNNQRVQKYMCSTVRFSKWNASAITGFPGTTDNFWYWQFSHFKCQHAVVMLQCFLR